MTGGYHSRKSRIDAMKALGESRARLDALNEQHAKLTARVHEISQTTNTVSGEVQVLDNKYSTMKTANESVQVWRGE